MEQKFCPFCGGALVATDNFCPHCGKQLRDSAQPLSLSRQLYIYAMSLLLPPFGLVWTFKYFRSDNTKLRTLGLVAGGITILSFFVSLWWFVGFWNGIQQQISSYSSLTY